MSNHLAKNICHHFLTKAKKQINLPSLKLSLLFVGILCVPLPYILLFTGPEIRLGRSLRPLLCRNILNLVVLFQISLCEMVSFLQVRLHKKFTTTNETGAKVLMACRCQIKLYGEKAYADLMYENTHIKILKLR